MQNESETIKVCELDGEEVRVDINSGIFSIEFGNERLHSTSLRVLKEQFRKKKMEISTKQDLTGKSIIYNKYQDNIGRNGRWVWLVGTLTGKIRKRYGNISVEHIPNEEQYVETTELWLDANSVYFGNQVLADKLNDAFRTADEAQISYEEMRRGMSNILGIQNTG